MEPNYTIVTTDAFVKGRDIKPIERWLMRAILVVVCVAILGSIIFKENLFADMAFTSSILLFTLVMWTISKMLDSNIVWGAAPLEIRFYDDYFVMFLPKRWYSSRVTRQTTNTMKYSDVTRVTYNSNTNDPANHMVQIYGDGKSVWYKYKKDGTLPEKPTEERIWTKGMIYFNTRLDPGLDIVKEIEEHSPLRFERKESDVNK